MSKIPKISIVIPVKNGAQTINNCILGIKKQTIYNITETIIIDSGSTDGSIELIKKFKDIRLYEIQPEDFNHGMTRNFGVTLAKGDYIVMTVQDAIAADKYWLENMYRHFSDPELAGVCGQQIVPPHKDKNPHQWYRSLFEELKPTIIHFRKGKDFLSLSPQEQYKYCHWDDVTTMYKKNYLLKYPFQKTYYGEDIIWIKDALGSGLKVIYDNCAKVEHYHHHTPDYTYKRTLIVWLKIYKTFGILRKNPISLSDYILIVYRNFKWRAHPKWIIYNWSLIYSIKKAYKTFEKAIRTNNLDKIESMLSINIPKGIVK